jgi:hypothetical protein
MEDSKQWEVGKYYCIECGNLLDKGNTDIQGYGNTILCDKCHIEEVRRSFKGNSHFSTSNPSGLQLSLLYFCEGCGTRLDTPGICKCKDCQEALSKFLGA